MHTRSQCRRLGIEISTIVDEVALKGRRAALRRLSMSEEQATARYQVLHITELLEAILLALPMKDLLVAQRFDRHFKAVIDNSVKIQRALYFLPEPVRPHHSTDGPIANPLLDDARFAYRSLLVVREGDDCNITYLNSAVVYKADHTSASNHLHAFKAILSLENHTIGADEYEDGEMRRLVRKVHLNGSWRRMFLTQPPVRTSTMVDGKRQDMLSEKVKFGQGLTLEGILGSTAPFMRMSMDAEEYFNVLKRRKKGELLPEYIIEGDSPGHRKRDRLGR